MLAESNQDLARCNRTQVSTSPFSATSARIHPKVMRCARSKWQKSSKPSPDRRKAVEDGQTWADSANVDRRSATEPDQAAQTLSPCPNERVISGHSHLREKNGKRPIKPSDCNRACQLRHPRIGPTRRERRSRIRLGQIRALSTLSMSKRRVHAGTLCRGRLFAKRPPPGGGNTGELPSWRGAQRQATKAATARGPKADTACRIPSR